MTGGEQLSASGPAPDHGHEASYRDGILEVRVPIDVATAEAKQIPITTGDA